MRIKTKKILGVEFGGNCPKCGSEISKKDIEGLKSDLADVEECKCRLTAIKLLQSDEYSWKKEESIASELKNIMEEYTSYKEEMLNDYTMNAAVVNFLLTNDQEIKSLHKEILEITRAEEQRRNETKSAKNSPTKEKVIKGVLIALICLSILSVIGIVIAPIFAIILGVYSYKCKKRRKQMAESDE